MFFFLVSCKGNEKLGDKIQPQLFINVKLNSSVWKRVFKSEKLVDVSCLVDNGELIEVRLVFANTNELKGALMPYVGQKVKIYIMTELIFEGKLETEITHGVIAFRPVVDIMTLKRLMGKLDVVDGVNVHEMNINGAEFEDESETLKSMMHMLGE